MSGRVMIGTWLSLAFFPLNSCQMLVSSASADPEEVFINPL